MLRAYRRNEYEGVIQGYIIETGIGFSINVDFNKFSEIFNRKKANIEGLEEANKHRKANVEESK
jgi:translocation and assembly module TamB